MSGSTSGLENECNCRSKNVVFVSFKPIFLYHIFFCSKVVGSLDTNSDAPPILLLFFSYVTYFTQLTNRRSSALHQKGRNVVDKFSVPSISVRSTMQASRTFHPFTTYLQCHA
jgi:hypothetical protein